MNSVCPECGGSLKSLGGRDGLLASYYYLYGCKDCYRVFWSSGSDTIPPKK